MTGPMWVVWGVMAGVAGVYGWSWKRAGTQGRKWLEWGLAALVAGVSLSSMLMHEPWADELHTWLQARELTVGELWREMAYEGHFLPWYLILDPFARLGAPVETMGWISWAINTVTVVWFVRKAPLEGCAKAVAVLSCVFLYVNPVVSRCYVLVPPVLFGLAALWRRRDAMPVVFGLLVALLANTHVCMEGTAGLLFAVFVLENVFRRKDGKTWRACRRQWAGLGFMAAGFAVAVAQILPSFWKSSVEPGKIPDRGQCLAWLCQGCTPAPVGWTVVAGLVWLGVEAWRRDRSVFAIYVGSLVFLAGFAMFLYPAVVPNRALLWWPVAIWTGWVLADGRRDAGDRGAGWVCAAVAATGLGLARFDMTWRDWREAFDPLPVACRTIVEKYGRDAEVWIDGHDYYAEGAAAYLDRLMDWRTGMRAERFRWEAGSRQERRPFQTCLEDIFRSHPGRESIRILASLAGGEDGLGLLDLIEPGVNVEYLSRQAICPWSGGTFFAKVMRIDFGKRSEWQRDRHRTMAALARLIQLDEGQWEAMNNLAWLCAEEGRVEEARAWMDRAMEHEEARTNAGVWDTEAAVRRAEGNEEGARDAEKRRDELRHEE